MLEARWRGVMVKGRQDAYGSHDTEIVGLPLDPLMLGLDELTDPVKLDPPDLPPPPPPLVLPPLPLPPAESRQAAEPEVSAAASKSVEIERLRRIACMELPVTTRATHPDAEQHQPEHGQRSRAHRRAFGCAATAAARAARSRAAAAP